MIERETTISIEAIRTMEEMTSDFRLQLAKQSCLLARRLGRTQIDKALVERAEQAVIAELVKVSQADARRRAA